MSKMRNVMVFLGLADEDEERYDPRYQDPRMQGGPGMGGAGPHTGPQPMRPGMGPGGPGPGQGSIGPQGPMSGGIPQPPPRGQMGGMNQGYSQYAPNEGSIRTVPHGREDAGVPMGGASVVPRPNRPAVRREGPVRKVENKVHVVEPAEFGDAKEIGDRLKNGQPVVVSVVDTEPALGRRITDFCSACVYMVDGKMQRVASNVFLCTPTSADISEGEKKRLQERGLYRL